ncbi:MAG: glycoside hydrolase family 3 N-terminal domain-containing protein, partial [Bacteroidota bacterium]|nr:glycoside hydrolase family 3 N-terminal domain-containing protein [Bacteroidota bacterium]
MNKVHLPSKDQVTLSQKMGQLFMPAVFINDTEEEVQKMEQLIANYHIGSLCFFHSRASAATNFEGKKQIVYNEKSYGRLVELIARYQKAAKIPLLIAIDAEWGLAMRIENTPQYPYAITLGALQNREDLIYHTGKAIGRDCLSAGIHWNLAPVVDINSNPENPVIGYRSFGDDKQKVFTKAEAFIRGMSEAGILNSIKHFPGHGDTATDSHLGLPVIDKSLEDLQNNELYPFQQLIQKGVDSVMVGHLLLPQLDNEGPSTTSHKIITGLLRNQMGFDGVIISDALNMHAVSKTFSEKGKLEAKAFSAGMDVLCFSENIKEGIDLILQQETEDRIEASFERIWKLKEKAFSNTNKSDGLDWETASEINSEIAQNCLTERIGRKELLEEIRASNFLNLAVHNGKANLFSKGLEEAFGHPVLKIPSDQGIIQQKLDETETVVLSLFPPAVKPKDQFGFDDVVLQIIKSIINGKKVLLYLF